ncbi:MAG: SpoIIE family protein phosphatase, partial [Calditrichia bacterium]|nr:SpoIIE family protein phosphatase [Calditrichia bacterium]
FKAKTSSITELTTGGLPLGYMEEALYKENEASFDPNDVLVLFTNSLPDTTNLSNEILGSEAIKTILKDNYHLSAKEILAKLVALPKWYSQGKILINDISIIVIKHKVA